MSLYSPPIIDRGHIHNHLIFDAINFTNHNCDRFNKRSYHEMHRYQRWVTIENLK